MHRPMRATTGAIKAAKQRLDERQRGATLDLVGKEKACFIDHGTEFRGALCVDALAPVHSAIR